MLFSRHLLFFLFPSCFPPPSLLFLALPRRGPPHMGGGRYVMYSHRPSNLGLCRAEHWAEKQKWKDPAGWVEAPRNMEYLG